MAGSTDASFIKRGVSSFWRGILGLVVAIGGISLVANCSRLIDLHTLIRDTLITYRGKYDINKTEKQILYTSI